MKTFNFLLAAALTLAPQVVFSQDPGPSPTASYGCEPHGDHWHCDGAITASTTLQTGTNTATNAAVTTTSAPHNGHDHDHEDEDHDHDHDHASGTGSLAPSPTESVGCVAHGDHYHCDGPRTSLTSVAANRTIAAGPTAGTTTTTPAGTAATQVPPNSAAGLKVGFGAVVLAVAVGFAL